MHSEDAGRVLRPDVGPGPSGRRGVAPLARWCGTVLLRSFFPLAALVVILGTTVWGPWASLALTAALWLAVDSLESAL